MWEKVVMEEVVVWRAGGRGTGVGRLEGTGAWEESPI